MASQRDSRFFKESGASSSEGTASKNDSSSTSKYAAFTASSPPILEPSKDESGYYRIPKLSTLVERVLPRSQRLSPTETTPTVSGNQPNGCDSDQQTNRLVEGGTNGCTSVMNKFKNSMIRLRNSECMPMVQLLFYLIPISAIIMGLCYKDDCPKASNVPVFGAIVGFLGIVFVCFWIYMSSSDTRGTPCSTLQTFLFGVICFIVLVVTIVDAAFVFQLSPSFDPASKDYCNETFYTYAFYKEIATAVAVVLLAILYLPGSRLIFCCYDCPMRSTSASYVSL